MKKDGKLILQTELGALHGRGVTGRPIMRPSHTPQPFLSNPSCRCGRLHGLQRVTLDTPGYFSITSAVRSNAADNVKPLSKNE